jgi:hypothetical protein
MRTLFGIVIGAFLTVSAAYIYDSHNAADVATDTAALRGNLVNWDVVGTKWQTLTERARAEWNLHAG